MADRLLDTNALSAAMAGSPAFSRYLTRIGDDGRLMTSVIAEGEIRFGISRLPEGKKRRRLSSLLARVIEDLHGVLPITRDIAARYAVVKSELWRSGKPIGENDLWIAATALEHQLRVVTSDRDLAHVEGLRTEDWSFQRQGESHRL